MSQEECFQCLIFTAPVKILSRKWLTPWTKYLLTQACRPTGMIFCGELSSSWGNEAGSLMTWMHECLSPDARSRKLISSLGCISHITEPCFTSGEPPRLLQYSLFLPHNIGYLFGEKLAFFYFLKIVLLPNSTFNKLHIFKVYNLINLTYIYTHVFN